MALLGGMALMAFDLDGYVDVAERISIFNEKYPQGSLQSELTRLEDGWLCKAFAYRDHEDPRPGIGHAFEPVPGKTPYTRDSEAMNAETSAWGRAIVALGFETKKIASAQEVRNRQAEELADEAKHATRREKSIRETAEEFAQRAGVDFWEVAQEVLPDLPLDKGDLTRDEAKAVCEEIAKRKKAK